MKVFIDGIIYQRESVGGISRVFNEILPRMCDLDDSMEIKLVTQGRLKQKLPAHKNISDKRLPPIERRFGYSQDLSPFMGRVNNMFLDADPGSIWHSSYYTMPWKWNGPAIITVVDLIHERLPKIFNSKENVEFRKRKKACIRKADAIISISDTTKRDIINYHGIRPEKIHVIYLGCGSVMNMNIEDMNAPKPQKPFILYVGVRTTAHKNFEVLLNAFSMWEHNNDYDLVLIGQDLLPEEERIFRSMGIRGKIKIYPNAGDVILKNLYNMASVYVYPSIYEGFGIPLLEAMSCGCPIVASSIPSTREVAGDCPIYFDLNDKYSLINSLNRAIAEGRESKRTKEALEMVNNYSWQNTAEGTYKIYKDLLS